MEKLTMCRICLAENVRMHLVVNRNLHELYEKLTDIPFVTEDSRPILACFFCFAKLKQCYRFVRKCLEAEKLFAQMMNQNYEPSPLINQNQLKFYGGFIQSPIEHMNIIDECQTESIAIKEELPAVCERLDDIIEPKKEHQTDETRIQDIFIKIEPENFDNSSQDVADIPPYHSESDLEDDVPLMKFKIEVEEEQEVSKEEQRARETKRAVGAKNPKLDTRRIKQEDAVTAEQTKKDKSNSKVIRTTQKLTSKPGTCSKEPYKCEQRSFKRVKKMIQHTRTQIGEKPYKCDVCQSSFRQNYLLSQHIRVHTGEKPYKCNICERRFSNKSHLTQHMILHTGEKPYKCDICQRSFSQNGTLKIHFRRHTGEKPYKCNICQRGFIQKGTLTKHIRQHTGEKPFKCDVCHRSFSVKGSLTKHIRQHTGEKPYKCDVCDRRFCEKGSLTKHARKHSGEKPLKCI